MNIRNVRNVRNASNTGADIEISTTYKRRQTLILTTRVVGPKSPCFPLVFFSAGGGSAYGRTNGKRTAGEACQPWDTNRKQKRCHSDPAEGGRRICNL